MIIRNKTIMNEIPVDLPVEQNVIVLFVNYYVGYERYMCIIYMYLYIEHECTGEKGVPTSYF